MIHQGCTNKGMTPHMCKPWQYMVHPWGTLLPNGVLFKNQMKGIICTCAYMHTITIFHFNKQKIIIHKMVKICHNICMIEQRQDLNFFHSIVSFFFICFGQIHFFPDHKTVILQFINKIYLTALAFSKLQWASHTDCKVYSGFPSYLWCTGQKSTSLSDLLKRTNI